MTQFKPKNRSWIGNIYSLRIKVIPIVFIWINGHQNTHPHWNNCPAKLRRLLRILCRPWAHPHGHPHPPSTAPLPRPAPSQWLHCRESRLRRRQVNHCYRWGLLEGGKEWKIHQCWSLHYQVKCSKNNQRGVHGWLQGSQLGPGAMQVQLPFQQGPIDVLQKCLPLFEAIRKDGDHSGQKGLRSALDQVLAIKFC